VSAPIDRAALLREAGITVETGLCADRAAADHAGFFLKTVARRPFVTLKLANSFDGRIATGTGESQWITGPSARRAVHAMRARHDAVMVGGGTARQDDPSLTVRGLGIARQPTRIVISRRLDIPLLGNLARTAGDVPVLLCHGRDADPILQDTWRGLGARLLPCATVGSQLDPRDVLHQLADHGITRVFCEGGSALAATLIEADLVDRLVGFTAGLTIGAEGLPNIGALGLGKLAEAARFDLLSVRAVGRDICHEWARRSA
jgi:diaminohydroxyphosphoribosylaminopyrimidine deaminase/5-amino-6-(5-phosphoribosylamino)uracil reductase